MKSRQQGLSLIGMLLVAILLGAVLLLGLKVIPAYNEYFIVKRLVKVISAETNPSASESTVRKDIALRMIADESSLTAIKHNDFIIRRQGGRVVIAAEWEHRIPLVSNASLVLDFRVDSSQGD
jgi:hypothetical protein